MIRYFYEKSEPSNAYLFKDTAIWQKEEYRALQGTFPVIYLSFKECKKSTWTDAYDHLQIIILEEFEKHATYLTPTLISNDLRDYIAILNRSASQSVLENSLYLLTKVLKQYYKKRGIVLIDEYDTPMRAAYDLGDYKEATSFLRGLLSGVLKDNRALHKGVLTGILCAAKEGIFSGLNNLSSILFLETRFSNKFGFTALEVDQLLNDYKIKTNLESIKEWYNGYRSGNTLLFNPWSILECIDHKGELRAYWGNTSNNALIQKIIPLASNDTKNDLEMLLQRWDYC